MMDLLVDSRVSRLRLTWTAAIWAGTVVIAAYTAWVLTAAPAASTEEPVSSFTLILLALLAAVLGLAVALRRGLDVRLRRGWLFISIGLLSYMLAEVTWFYFETVLGQNPFMTLADVFYLAYYPLVFTGLILLPFAPSTRRERITLFMDLAIILTAAFMIVWQMLLAPMMQAGRFNLSTVIALAYPLGDLLLIAGVIALIQRDVENVAVGALVCLAGALIVNTTADILFAFFEMNEVDFYAPLLNSLWMMQLGLQAWAAYTILCLPPGRPAARQGEAPPTRRLLRVSLPYVAVGVGLGLLLMVYHFYPAENLPFSLQGLIYSTVLLVLLVSVRQYMVLRENQALYEQMHSLAITDTLTGLYNRHYFNEAFPRELARAERYNTQLCVILADINRFKRINDQYGHLEGDQALKSVARALRSNLRAADLAARFGGDEFVILLPETNLEQARMACNRLMQAVAACTLPDGATLSLSMGLAAFTPGDTPERLLETADQQLYRQKGRLLAGIRG